MTRIDYAKPKMFPHPQGPTLDNLTTTCAIVIYPLLGFSQTSGISHSALTRLGTRTLLGFVPFQRHNHCDATNETSLSPLPAPRFSQPSSRSNALVDLQVYPTLQALLGLRSSKLHTDTISTSSSETDCSFVVTISFMVSFNELACIPAYIRRRGLPLPTTSPIHSPLSSFEDRLPSWTLADLEAFIPHQRIIPYLEVSPTRYDDSFLDLFLLQGLSLVTLGYPSPL
jgi:hypothetical protein